MTVHAHVDWVSIVESAYAPLPDEQWANELNAVCETALGEDAFGFHVTRHDRALSKFDTIVERSPWDGPWGTFGQLVSSIAPAQARQLYAGFGFKAGTVNTALAVEQHVLAPEHAALNRSFRASVGIADALGLVVRPLPGTVATFYWPTKTKIALNPVARRHFLQLALHLETAVRLRCSPECLVAVLDNRGKLLHREPTAPSVDQLQKQVKDIETVRGGALRAELGGLDLWQALVNGAVSLVARREGSRRHYLVLSNPLHAHPMRALTKGEVDAATLAARGFSNKLAGYALGLCHATISARLASASVKLGLRSRTELIHLTALLTRPIAEAPSQASLSEAERDIAELITRGLSNAQIAAVRGRSSRTVANQVAEILRKTGTTGRKGIAAHFRVDGG